MQKGFDPKRADALAAESAEMKEAEDEIRRRNRELYVLNNTAVTFNKVPRRRPPTSVSKNSRSLGPSKASAAPQP